MSSLKNKFLLGFLLIGFLLPVIGLAASNNPFGGLVTFKLNCRCSQNQLIIVNPPKEDLPRSLVFDRGSILYEFRKLEVGEEILGTWEGNRLCLVPGPDGCATPIPVPWAGVVAHPRIYMVGTSGGQVDGGGGGGEPSQPQCNDGRDNDGDGRVDYPDDPGCESLDDNSERDTQCSDGIDNDGDGKIDYPDDPECHSPSDNSEDSIGCECNCVDGKEEEETREELRAGGIEINKGPCPRNNPNDPCESTSTGGGKFSCTDVRCLPQVVIDGLIELKQKVGTSCPVVITGGTEPGHKTHGQCKPIVDLRIGNACLDNYIKNNATSRTSSDIGMWYILTNLSVGTVRFLDENRPGYTRHWHVVFDGGRPTTQPVDDCLIKKYIIANEGWENKVYRDSKGYLTVGVGHKVRPGEGYREGQTISDEEVRRLFESDYPEHKQSANLAAAQHGLDLGSLDGARQLVLIDMGFNMGEGNVSGGGLASFNKMFAAIKREDWNEASKELLDSDYANDVGARARRNADIMRTGDVSIAEGKINQHEKARTYCQS